ncbi:putative metabolite transport protein CsbC [Piscirickettsia salmonis]|uniref:MFS transporter n=2 Tax=Piscirickettsia salmonis TaxID=1238 RepID=UPI0012BA5C02|nr:MFS transporter [Piscirickettsia salmonis]QGP53012.1 putative metabolite transport protein CsbC [Piscirickettsia salmonis]QGP61057.1 putative metabolite transport protein CsbC [Piscirickettsia salmonis]QGP62584.1 putative metabolite transport protein CsbC [Piscirickettsia salmonis]
MSDIPSVQSNNRLSRDSYWYRWLMGAMGLFVNGFDLFMIAVALPLIIHVYQPSATVIGMIGASTTLGAIVGAIVMGRLTDVLGRRKLLLVNILFFVVFTVLSSLSWGVVSLIVFRFLLGIAIGGEYPLSSTYIAESMPKHLRGRFMTAGFAFQAFGALLGAVLGVIILNFYPSDNAWRVMLALGLAPAVVLFVLRRGLPESEKWLKMRQEKKQARSAQLGYRELFKKKYIKITILTSVSWFIMDVALYGLGFYTPMIFSQFGASPVTNFILQDIASTQNAIILDCFLLIGVFIAMLGIERWGRLRLQKFGFLGMAVGLGILASSGEVGAMMHVPLLFTGFILFYLMVNAGPNPTTYMLPAELFPTEIRASGHGFASASGKLGATLGVFFLPMCVEAFGLGITVGTIAVLCILGFFVTTIFGVETKGRELGGEFEKSENVVTFSQKAS